MCSHVHDMVGMINGGCSHGACGKCEINDTGDCQNGMMMIVLVIMVIISYGDWVMVRDIVVMLIITMMVMIWCQDDNDCTGQ